MEQAFPVTVRVDANLAFFFRGKTQASERLLRERTSVKDVIEACGIPHTEVDLILVNGERADFALVLGSECEVEVFGVPAPDIPDGRSHLQRQHHTRFLADGHVGKLTRRLRLLGFDVSYEREADDARLVHLSVAEDRALLTRDRRLLMHRAVQHGYFLRSQNPEEQATEVLQRFRMRDSIAPFTRCIDCNGLIEPVSKAEVLASLEPLTKKYYDEFRRCSGCARVYWAGSHFEKLKAQLRQLLGDRDSLHR